MVDWISGSIPSYSKVGSEPFCKLFFVDPNSVLVPAVFLAGFFSFLKSRPLSIKRAFLIVCMIKPHLDVSLTFRYLVGVVFSLNICFDSLPAAPSYIVHAHAL